MTKHRPPLSIDAALARIAGQLPRGWDEVAEIAGRKPRTVRNWSDPDAPEQVPVDCAIALDLSFQEAGGVGAPIFEAYSHMLERAELGRFADRFELAEQTMAIIRESGEAHAALVQAAQRGSTPADIRRAESDTSEALDALRRALPILTALSQPATPQPAAQQPAAEGAQP